MSLVLAGAGAPARTRRGGSTEFKRGQPHSGAREESGRPDCNLPPSKRVWIARPLKESSVTPDASAPNLLESRSGYRRSHHERLSLASKKRGPLPYQTGLCCRTTRVSAPAQSWPHVGRGVGALAPNLQRLILETQPHTPTCRHIGALAPNLRRLILETLPHEHTCRHIGALAPNIRRLILETQPHEHTCRHIGALAPNIQPRSPGTPRESASRRIGALAPNLQRFILETLPHAPTCRHIGALAPNFKGPTQ